MRRFRTMLMLGLVALLAVTLAPAAKADDYDFGDWSGVDGLIDSLPDSFGSQDEDSLSDPVSAYESLLNILAYIPDIFARKLRDGLGRGAAIVCISALCGMASSIADDKNLGWAVELSGIAAVTTVSGGAFSFISLGAQTAAQLADWSALVLPVMATATASAGGVSSSAAKYAAASLGIGLVSKLAASLVLPLIYAYLALSLSAAAFSGSALKAAAKLVKQFAVWVLTLSSGMLLAYLVLSGATAVSVDAVAAKSVKTALGALPVVGSITSDAASAVLAGAAAVRSTAGIIGVIGVLGVCLEPMLALLAQVLLFKAASALSGCFASDGLKSLIDDFGTALGLSLASCGFAALMLFFSLVSFMQAVAV